MKNLILGILVASTAILGFFGYQSSQTVTGLQAELAVRESALTTMETEKAALVKQVADLQAQVEALMAAEAAIAATDVPAAEGSADQTGVTDPADASDGAATATNP